MKLRVLKRLDNLKTKVFEGKKKEKILRVILYTIIFTRDFIRISMIMANGIMFVSPIIFCTFLCLKVWRQVGLQ